MAYQMDAANSFEAGCKEPLLVDGDTHYIVWRDADSGDWALVAYEPHTDDRTVLTETEARQVLGGWFNQIPPKPL